MCIIENKGFVPEGLVLVKEETRSGKTYQEVTKIKE